MSIYTHIITYDAHRVRNYGRFYAAMNAHSGVRLAESVWGLTVGSPANVVRDWLRGLLDDDDTIVVVQLKPFPSWATSSASKEANAWLSANIAIAAKAA